MRVRILKELTVDVEEALEEAQEVAESATVASEEMGWTAAKVAVKE